MPPPSHSCIIVRDGVIDQRQDTGVFDTAAAAVSRGVVNGQVRNVGRHSRRNVENHFAPPLLSLTARYCSRQEPLIVTPWFSTNVEVTVMVAPLRVLAKVIRSPFTAATATALGKVPAPVPVAYWSRRECR